MSIIKIQEDIQEHINSQLSTKQDVAQALVRLQQLQKFIKEIDASVRKKAVEIFEEEDENNTYYESINEVTGEYKKYYVSNRPATMTKEYNPERIFEAFGPVGIKFMKVKKTAVDKFITQGLKARAIDPEKAKLALSDAIEKPRAGGITVKEVNERI